MEPKFNIDDMKKYYQLQTEICLCSDLYSDKKAHGSKIIMLFAEVFSFMVDIYGLNNTSNLIINYSNTAAFKKWFWNVKFNLGNCLKEDPTFYEIGKWIGKGFFLKICLSLILNSGMILEEKVIQKMVEKQKKLIKELHNECIFYNVNLFIEDINYNSYTLFNQKVHLYHDQECFFNDNLIN